MLYSMFITDKEQKMANLETFNNPLMLGFENIERMIDQVAKASSEGYPPYDIEQISDTKTNITLAVAGFSEEDLSITLEDGKLVIKGKHAQTEADKLRKYIYKGIAFRQFQRVFVLADGMEIKGATLVKGLLTISLERKKLEAKITRIAINDLDKPKGLKNKNAKLQR